MSPPAVQQVISALKVILGEDGTNRGVHSPFHTSYFSQIQIGIILEPDMKLESDRGKEVGPDKGE
jgi:hypothetical protein